VNHLKSEICRAEAHGAKAGRERPVRPFKSPANFGWHPALFYYSLTVPMRHTISVLVENKFGVLARVSGMFSGRGFNIDSLNVAPTHDATLSRITTVLNGDEAALDLCIKQLRKLVNVVEVVDFKEGQAVERELVLVKVKAEARTRSEIVQIADIFRAKIVNLGSDNLIIELTGSDDKVGALLSLLEPFGILELARTGRLALKR
jgi:acetolactate synthase-1/3 small subunit